MHGPIAPNDEIGLNVRKLVRDAKKTRRLVLAIASWWLGDLGILVREDLRQDPEDEVQLALRAKSISLEVLQSKFSERDFFGNLLTELRKVLSLLRVSVHRQQRSKRKIRHRGYRDHGTLRPSYRWVETSDWSFDEEQSRIEESRALRNDTLDLLEGFLSG
jgi:hypothetical protein